MGSRLLVAVAAIVVAALGVALFVLTRRDPEPASPHLTPTVAPTHAAVEIAIDGREQSRVAITIDAAAVASPSERDTALASLRSSGPGNEGWDAQATALFDAFARRTVEVTEVGCFIAGCGAMLTFPSDATYRRELEVLQASAEYLAWTGGKKLTPPEVGADGRVSIALLLYRPD